MFLKDENIFPENTAVLFYQYASMLPVMLVHMRYLQFLIMPHIFHHLKERISHSKQYRNPGNPKCNG